MPTYAYITGRITLPDSNIGVLARVIATPLTSNAVLRFDGDRATFGPAIAETGTDGVIKAPGVAVPVIEDVMWRITVEPLAKYPGVPYQRVTVGDFEITENVTFESLVQVSPTVVVELIYDTVLTARDQAQTSRSGAEVARLGAESARDEAVAIVIADVDEAMASAFKTPGTATATAVTGTLNAQVPSLVTDALADDDAPALAAAAAAETAVNTYVAELPNKVIKTRGQLRTWGHSYAFGIGASDNAKRYGVMLASALGLEEFNEAVSGTAFASDVSGASWVKFLQTITRSTRGAVPGSGVTATAQAGFAPPPGIDTLFYGVNDINSLGNTSSALAPVHHAFRAAISRLRAGAVFEADTASIWAWSSSGSSDWGTVTDSTKNSGTNYRYTSVEGAAYQFALPAEFPGGTVTVGIIAPSGVGQGATHTSTSSSLGGPRTIDAHNPRNGSMTPIPWRLTGLPAGAQTIFVTCSDVVGSTIVDYVQWEAPNDKAPLTVVFRQPYPVDYSAYGSTPPGPPTDAGVDALNAIIDALPGEFGDRVLVVNTSVMNHDATMFAADKLHPSDKGNRTLYELALNAIRSGGYVLENGPKPSAPRYEYGTAAPTWTRTYYEAGSFVENTAKAVLGPTGARYVIDGWLCTASGRPASWQEVRRPIESPASLVATTAELNAIGNAVNTAGKHAGRQVFNTTTSRPVYATGSTAASTWVDATGAVAHTPA